MNDTITAIEGVLVGHAQNDVTGCTVIILEKQPGIVSADVRGGALGTCDVAKLDPSVLWSVQTAEAIFIAGGSHFGLDIVPGIRSFLQERATDRIVGANISDFAARLPDKRPTPEMARQACEAASSEPVSEGNVGAGTGATVGKLLGKSRAMKGGLGNSVVRFANGLAVGALVVVNAVGNVFDVETGRTIAGARRDRDDGFWEMTDFDHTYRGLTHREQVASDSNTTVGVVVTNGKFNPGEVCRIALMAQGGLARSIRPVHMQRDGDMIFAVSLCEIEADLDFVGHHGAEQVAKAVVCAVRAAKTVPAREGIHDLLPGLADWRMRTPFGVPVGAARSANGRFAASPKFPPSLPTKEHGQRKVT